MMRIYEGKVIGTPIISKDYIQVNFQNMYQPSNEHYSLRIHSLGHWCNANAYIYKCSATWVIHNAPDDGHVMWSGMPLENMHIREHLFDAGDLYLHGTRYPCSGYRTDVRVADHRCIVKVGDE